MKLTKKSILIIIIVVLIAGGYTAFLKFTRATTITGYKDNEFYIYECSKPIKAKKGTVPMLFGGRQETLVPANQAEADKYCHKVGIE